MSTERKILEKLALGLSQRQITKSVKTSSHKVIAVRRFCNERNLTFEDALKLNDDELMIKKRKEVIVNSAKRPDYEYIHSELKKKGVTLKLLHDEYKRMFDFIEMMRYKDKSFEVTYGCSHYLGVEREIMEAEENKALGLLEAIN